jgi:hypothetical protein
VNASDCVWRQVGRSEIASATVKTTSFETRDAGLIAIEGDELCDIDTAIFDLAPNFANLFLTTSGVNVPDGPRVSRERRTIVN